MKTERFSVTSTMFRVTVAAVSIFAAATLLPQAAHAAPDAMEDPLFELSGFGTFAATRTDDSSAGYRVYPQTGAKANEWAFDTDSLLGVQLDVAGRERLSAVVQVIGRKREKSSWDPEIEWAYIKYDISPSLRLRVGRLLTPVFMESDYRFVGYANTFVRPENTVYSTYPLSNHDGITVTHTSDLGGGALILSAFGGTSALDIPGKLTWEGDVIGLTSTYELSNLTLRFGHTEFRAKITGDVQAFKTAATNLATAVALAGCTTCVEVGKAYERLTGGYVQRYTNIGARYSRDALTTWAEYNVSRNNTVTQSSISYLLGASYRAEKWTPYLAYGRYRVTANDKAVITDGPLLLREGVNAGFLNQATSRHVYSVGTRYDLQKNYALKAEVSRINLDNSSANPNNFPVVPAVGAGVVVSRPQNFNLFSVTLDFVF